jgi:hypothetical protein
VKWSALLRQGMAKEMMMEITAEEIIQGKIIFQTYLNNCTENVFFIFFCGMS